MNISENGADANNDAGSETVLRTTDTDNNGVFEFGGFRLDIVRRSLTDPDGRPVSLSSRTYDALLCFVEHPGALLDKIMLMNRLWPDTVVEDNNLNQVIASLRKALGDSSKTQRFIATEPGRGYRFVAEVSEVERSASAASPALPTQMASRKRWIAIFGVFAALVLAVFVASRFMAGDSRPAQLSGPQPSVAVLPFADLSPGGDQEYFSSGVAEEILSQLSQIDDLKVTGRASSFAFNGHDQDLRVIGQTLNVDHILDGSIRKAGDRVRISVRLVKAADGFQLWAETYERNLTDIFAIQDEIAKSICNALSITLGVGPGDLRLGGTRNFDAFDAFLEAGSSYNEFGPDNSARAIRLMEHAVTLDPNFARAWSALSIYYDDAATWFVDGEVEGLYEKSKAAATRAAEIAPEAVGPLLALANVQARNGEWLQAEQSHRKALERSPAGSAPNLLYGNFLLRVGRPSESIGYFRRAATADPLWLLPVQQTGFAHQAKEESQLALQEYQRAQELIGNRSFLQIVIALLGMETGDRALMADAFEKALDAGQLPSSSDDFPNKMFSLLDSPDEARAELRQLYEEPESNLRLDRRGLAAWAAYFGDPELALTIFRERVAQSTFGLFAAWQPIYGEMRHLPAFKDLVRDAGLLDYWRSSGNWGEFCRPVGNDDFECS